MKTYILKSCESKIHTTISNFVFVAHELDTSFSSAISQAITKKVSGVFFLSKERDYLALFVLFRASLRYVLGINVYSNIGIYTKITHQQHNPVKLLK